MPVASDPNAALSLHPSEHLAGIFSHFVALGVRDRSLLSGVLRSALDAQPDALATWTVWEPDAFDGRDLEFQHAPGHDATGRFIVCWHRAAGEPRLEPVHGYERPGSGDWYWVPKQRAVACSVAPFRYPLGGRWIWITSEIAPVEIDGKFVGVTGIDREARSKPDSSDRNPPPITLPLRTAALNTLTPREREVFHWLEFGKSNEEIGIILGISHHTVKNHLDHVFQKLGVHNRIEAMQTAHTARALGNPPHQ